MTEGIKLPNEKKYQNAWRKENLQVFEADTIKQLQVKVKLKKEYLRRTQKQLETKL